MKKRLGKFILVIIILMILMLVAQQGFFEHLVDSNWVADYINKHGQSGVISIFLLGILFTGIGGPRQVIAFVFGFAFGGLLGALYSTLATFAGCVLSFYVARLTLKKTLQGRFHSKLIRFEALIHRHTWLKVLMIRLLPIGSNLLTNILAGGTNVKASQFFAGSFIGFWPQMLIFSFAGAGIGLSDSTNLMISILLFIISSAIGAYLYKTRLRNQVDKLMTYK
ncbi:MAG: putative membrane protein YdjX (TVP38/TMEM64 family) [Psychromonas sp.]